MFPVILHPLRRKDLQPRFIILFTKSLGTIFLEWLLFEISIFCHNDSMKLTDLILFDTKPQRIRSGSSRKFNIFSRTSSGKSSSWCFLFSIEGTQLPWLDTSNFWSLMMFFFKTWSEKKILARIIDCLPNTDGFYLPRSRKILKLYQRNLFFTIILFI